MAPSFRGSISRVEWNLKWGFLKIHSGPLFLQENDRERAKPVSICLNIWPFWLVSTKLAAANHVSKTSDHFSVWLQSDRIFCQSYCTRTILVYVCQMDPLGACNGALFHGPTALSLISWILDSYPVATISKRTWKPEVVCKHGKGAHPIPKSGLNISW